MLLQVWATALVAGVVCLASPLVVSPRVATPLNELVERAPMGVTRDYHLQKRLSADFTLDREWNNDILFGGDYVEIGENETESVALEVICIECWTKGLVNAKLTTKDILRPNVRLDFEGIEAYVNVGVKASSTGATYAVNLFSSHDPVELGLSDLDLGLVFYLDLVFSLSAEVDLEGGFYVKLSDDSFLETDVFSGDITDHLFDNVGVKSLPIEVHTGTATFTAALRLRVQCGIEADADVIGLGAGGVVGIYANIVEFVSVVDSTPECGLQTIEWFDLNVGAYACFDTASDMSTNGAVPTVSTTFVTSPTWTLCGLDNSPAETNGVPTIAATSLETAASVHDPQSTGILFSNPSLNLTHPVEEGMATSTLYETAVYTVTSCATSVINCPRDYQKEMVITKTINTFPTSNPHVVPENMTAVHVVTDMVTLFQCDPITGTFMPTLPSDSAAESTSFAKEKVGPVSTMMTTSAMSTTASVPVESTTTSDEEEDKSVSMSMTTTSSMLTTALATVQSTTAAPQELSPSDTYTALWQTADMTSSLMIGSLGTGVPNLLPSPSSLAPLEGGVGRAQQASLLSVAFAAILAFVCGCIML